MEKNFLEGKKVIITGASSGIGEALAEGFPDIGAKVGLIARSEGKLDAITKRIQEKGKNAIYHIADVSDYNGMKIALKDLNKRLEGIDVLINNAGVAQYNPMNIKKEGIDKIIDVNLKGVLYSSALAVRYLKKSKAPSIINSSSGEARPPYGGGYVYACSKAALNRLATLSTPMNPFVSNSINVNSIMIYGVNTPIFSPIPELMLNMMKEAMFEETGLRPFNPEHMIPYFAFFVSKKGKRVKNKVVDMISVEQGLKIVKKLQNNASMDWDNLEIYLKEKLEDYAFNNIKNNRKLFRFLISNG